MKITRYTFAVVLILLISLQSLLVSQANEQYTVDQCLQKRDLAHLKFEGNIFYERVNENNSSLWYINQSLTPQMVHTDLSGRSSNPNLKQGLLAYIDTTPPKQILLINATGQIVIKIPWEDNWDYPIGLTLDHEIIVNHALSPQNTEIGFSILSFQKGTVVERVYDKFPFSTSYYTNKPSGIVASPTGENVIYQADLIGPQKEIKVGLILINKYPYTTTTNKVLWQSFDEIQTDGIRWSPDGSEFAYAPNMSSEDYGWSFPHPSEIALVNEDGNEIIRTHFNSSDDHYTPYNLSWSPNGQMLAFWLGGVRYGNRGEIRIDNETLFVWNIRTNTMFNLCLTNKIGSLAEFVWSPDSTHVIYQQNENDDDTIIIDMEKGSYFSLKTDAIKLIGWLSP